MIFALHDFYHYHHRSGRYERKVQRSGLMGMAYEETLPEDVVSNLQPGDLLFVLTFDSLISWSIVYLTSSHVSHSAMYIGEGHILHATTSGVTIEPIEVLYGSNERILPCVWHMPDEARAKVEDVAAKYKGVRYGWEAVSIKAIRLISGRDWPNFRWSFLFDIIVILIILDLPVLLFLRFPLFTFLIPLYLTIILFNQIFWKFKPLSFNEYTGYPSQILDWLYFEGHASLVPDFNALKHDSGVTAYRFKKDD
jgi:hypothetical protein